MKNWPKKHRLLFFLFFCGIAGVIAAYIYLLRPLQIDVRQKADSVRANTQEIRSKGWTVDEKKLLAIRRDKEDTNEELARRKDRIWELARASFADKLTKFEGAPDLFIDQVTRLDYQEEYVKVIGELSQGGRLQLHESVLKLSEDSVSPFIYQLVLRLWSLEKVMTQFAAHDLVPARLPVEVPRAGSLIDLSRVGPDAAPEAQYETRRISSVTVLPPRAYFAEAENSTPYLLECPVRATVRCDPTNLHRFLTSLGARDDLIIVNRLQIRKLRPDGNGRYDLEVDLECGTFFLLKTEFKLAPKMQPQAVPRGA